MQRPPWVARYGHQTRSQAHSRPAPSLRAAASRVAQPCQLHQDDKESGQGGMTLIDSKASLICQAEGALLVCLGLVPE
ncbi:hypothetical protein H8959_018432, partial [Pygathrix nigripes]